MAEEEETMADSLTVRELQSARDMFGARTESLSHDVRRCFWPIVDPAIQGPAFFPAAMYCFATLDYFSSFHAGWNRNAPQDENQTTRMVAFAERYLLYPREETMVAIHFGRHKLMHTAEPRLLRNQKTGAQYIWSIGGDGAGHMRLVCAGDKGDKTFRLHFCPPHFARDLDEGVFGAKGFFTDLRDDSDLQVKYRKCLKEFEGYEIDLPSAAEPETP